MKKTVLYSLLSLFLLFETGSSKEIETFKFTEEEMKTLKTRKIKGETTWTLGSNENGNFLKGEAKGKASGLGIEQKINLLETPYINITIF